MSEILALAVKALAGGTFVVAFALLAEALQPKRFAGLFGAAPSIALASLVVVLVTNGPAVARGESLGMMVGAAGLAVYCLAAVFLVRRFQGLAGSALAGAVWFAVSGAVYAVAFR